MAKIYNEVVIDMNPESPTFEETIYEAAFEYDGDMMLAQEDSIQEGTKMAIRRILDGKVDYEVYQWDGANWRKTGEHSWNKDDLGDMQVYSSFHAAVEAGGTAPESYGLESLKKSDFFEADGTTPKPMSEILALIKPHKPDVSDADILAQIEDMMPKLQEVSAEENGFAREGFQKDVYGISKDAGKVGAQMRSAYGSGMGSSMRGAIAGQKDVTQQFKQAEQGYAQDIYGLEQKQEEEFEGDVSTWLQGFKQGGRVPSKQTFLEVLSKIPDAGGN